MAGNLGQRSSGRDVAESCAGTGSVVCSAQSRYIRFQALTVDRGKRSAVDCGSSALRAERLLLYVQLKSGTHVEHDLVGVWIEVRQGIKPDVCHPGIAVVIGVQVIG